MATNTSKHNGTEDDPSIGTPTSLANADAEVPSVDTTATDKTESGEYEIMEGDYKVLQTQLVDTQTTDEAKTAQENDPDWSPRTSFTADSPYFDAFVDGEIGSLNLLSETLGDISEKARAFVRAGAVMSQATRRLALACKLRRDPAEDNNHGSGDENGLNEEELAKQRRGAVGEEMANVLELLGEVRWIRW